MVKFSPVYSGPATPITEDFPSWASFPKTFPFAKTKVQEEIDALSMEAWVALRTGVEVVKE